MRDDAIPAELASSNPREIALAVLVHFRDRDRDASRLLHDLLRRGEVRGADARLATDLALGVLRQRSRLDGLLARLTRRPWKKNPPVIRDLLRLGAYQLLFLDRVPAHAAVNETVELARRWTSPGHAALVNAILRRVSAEESARLEVRGGSEEAGDGRGEKGELRYPPKSDWPRFYSHPPWLVQYLLAHYAAERVAALLEWNNRTPLLMLRANRLRTSAAELAERLSAAGHEVTRVGWPAPDSLTVGGRLGELAAADWFVQGLATVQDGAAQLIGCFLAPQPGDRILDWCAAPGGKSTQLAELTGDRAEVLALDVDARRLAQVALAAERLGLKSVKPAPLTPGLLEQLAREPADAVLVDAPCTGLGTIQRHPDIRWRRKPRELERAAARQFEILSTAARCVKPGGRLVYSTCTLGPVENEQVVERFLAAHPEFEPVRRDDPAYSLPERCGAIVDPFLDGRGQLHTWPPEHALDGFYAARLARRT